LGQVWGQAGAGGLVVKEPGKVEASVPRVPERGPVGVERSAGGGDGDGGPGVEAGGVQVCGGGFGAVCGFCGRG